MVLLRHLSQISEGGFPVLLRKLKKLLIIVFTFIVSLPIVLVMRVLRPFIIIRLGKLDGGRIAALYNAEVYLCEHNSGIHKKRIFDIFYFVLSTGVVSNRQWIKMWKRVLRVVPFGKLAFYVDSSNKLVPGYSSHVIPMQKSWPIKDEAVKCILKCRMPNISFTPEEETLGRRALQELGIPKGCHFICFHTRDSAYLNTIQPSHDWNYHNYRDSSIHNYVLAVEEMVQRGFYAIRMGSIVKEKLDVDNPAIIDYATNGKRTEFLDIYLGAKCQFFLGSPTGISIVPELFRRPVVYTNWLHFPNIFTWLQKSLIIPKKLYLSEEKRFLNFRELIYSEIRVSGRSVDYEIRGIEVIENSPEEILAVASEMDERLNGTWETSEEDEKLQQSFWALFGPNKFKSPGLRIGADFLRRNKDWIC